MSGVIRGRLEAVWRGARGAAGRFGADRQGFALVFVAVALPALLGLVGLALDGGRLFTLDTQLAGIADSAALAAASRLDRSPAAIVNAREAAGALGRRASFASGPDSRTQLTFRFAATLADLRTSPSYTLADTAGAEAAFVEVTTAERSSPRASCNFSALARHRFAVPRSRKRSTSPATSRRPSSATGIRRRSWRARAAAGSTGCDMTAAARTGRSGCSIRRATQGAPVASAPRSQRTRLLPHGTRDAAPLSGGGLASRRAQRPLRSICEPPRPDRPGPVRLSPART
jgi:Flp pilus assembly protein TadG